MRSVGEARQEDTAKQLGSPGTAVAIVELSAHWPHTHAGHSSGAGPRTPTPTSLGCTLQPGPVSAPA